MIRAGSSEVQLVGLDPEEFPALARDLSEERCLHLSSGVLRTYDPSDGIRSFDK